MARLETKQMTTPSSPNLEQFARECAYKYATKEGEYAKIRDAILSALTTAGMVSREIHCPCCGRVTRQDANSFECDHCQKCFPKGHGHEGIPWVLIEQLQTQLAEALKDKERLDWLEEMYHRPEWLMNLSQDARAVIDSAIQQQKGSGK